MTRARRAGVAAAVALLFAACGPGRAGFEPHRLPELTAALRARHLDVCGAPRPSATPANQAVAGRVVRTAVDCRDGSVTLVANRFASAADRDAAARNLEVQVRPRADGTVWTWGPFTVEAVGPRDGATMERVVLALDDLGAR